MDRKTPMPIVKARIAAIMRPISTGKGKLKDLKKS